MRSIKKRSKRLKDTQCPQACGRWVSTGQFEIKKRPTVGTAGHEISSVLSDFVLRLAILMALTKLNAELKNFLKQQFNLINFTKCLHAFEERDSRRIAVPDYHRFYFRLVVI